MIIESYVVSNKVYVSTKFLCEYFNRTQKQIGRWKKDGLPVAKKPKEINERSDYFILEEAIAWVDANINKTKASNSKSNADNFDIEDDEALFNIYTNGNAQQKRKLLLRLPQNRLDNFKKIEDIVTQEAKNKEYDSKYVLVEDVKKGQQELATLFISTLKNSMPVLSKTLENKSQNEIYHLMDRHFKKEIEKLAKYIKTDVDMKVKLNTVIEKVVEIVSEYSIGHDEVIKKLEELI